jgi:Cu+-exporting ATPase
MLRLAQAQLVEVVEDTGFEGRALGQGAASDSAQLRVDGMTCGSCSAAVEKALRAAPGVLSASVNLMAGTAEVR